MHIERLEISDVRNLGAVRLQDLDKINVFYGDNGSGKTSLLESVHVLGLGRSFRTRLFKSVIQNEKEESVVFCSAYETHSERRFPVGVRRSRQATPEIRVQGRNVASLAELAMLFPLQLINSDAFMLLEGSPRVRRQFLDWGVFHVEHSFHAAWQSAKRCLKHRNSLLRHGKMAAQDLLLWTGELTAAAKRVDQHRQAYIAEFIRVFEPLVIELTDIAGLRIEYFRGWPAGSCLKETLDNSLDRDKQQGFTSFGPHKADLRITKDGRLVSECLSRGQEKLLICALKLAQAAVFEGLTDRKCIFLIDDLPAELDARYRRVLCHHLEELGCQVFITCIDRMDLAEQWRSPERIKWFHVEHGEITQVDTA
ncbi:MAG: DNA replication/repair protein RecF [Pseudomonadales bacterium]